MNAQFKAPMHVGAFFVPIARAILFEEVEDVANCWRTGKFHDFY